MSYDLNGNLTRVVEPRSSLRRSIVWDEDDRVERIEDNGRTTSFVYDDAGQRVIKLGAQGETVYVNPMWTVRNGRIATKHIFVGEMRIASKLTPGNAHLNPDEDLVSQMLGRWWDHRSDSGHQHGRNVAMNPHYRVPSSMPEGGTPETNFVYFYHPDHLSSTQYVTDGDGELYEHAQYFPGGETWVEQASNTERLPYLFTGQELDQETGLYYVGARYYDPRVGTWLATDPDLRGIGSVRDAAPPPPLALSAYAYGGHTPLVMIDPDGRRAVRSAYWSDADAATLLQLSQSITDDQLGWGGAGGRDLVIVERARGPLAHPKGTQLLRRVIGSDRVITLEPTTGNTTTRAANEAEAHSWGQRPGAGSDSTIYFNLQQQGQFQVAGPRRGTAVLGGLDLRAVLGHEFSHSDLNARGWSRPVTAGGVTVPVRVPGFRQPDIVREDEAMVTGIGPAWLRRGRNVTTENDIRRELGLPRRLSYHTGPGSF